MQTIIIHKYDYIEYKRLVKTKNKIYYIKWHRYRVLLWKVVYNNIPSSIVCNRLWCIYVYIIIPFKSRADVSDTFFYRNRSDSV